MRPDLAVVFRYGIKDRADPVADVVFDQISDEKNSQDYSDNRKCKVEIKYPMVTEPIGEEVVCIIEGIFERYSGETTSHTNQNTQNQHKRPLFDVAQPPNEQFSGE